MSSPLLEQVYERRQMVDPVEEYKRIFAEEKATLDANVLALIRDFEARFGVSLYNTNGEREPATHGETGHLKLISFRCDFEHK